MSAGASTVFLLADEPHALAALACILRAEGFAIRGWMSAAEFLDVHDADTPGCLITDVNMREISGLEVQRILLARGIDRPIIFITDQGDIRTTVLGMKAGAITFLAKPVLPNEVIGAVREAFAIDSTRRAQRSQQADFSARLARLTRREHQVFRLLTTGMSSKQIATELGAAESTVKSHRVRILSKMQVRTSSVLMGLLYQTTKHASPTGVAVEEGTAPTPKAVGLVSCTHSTAPPCCV